MKTLFIPAYRKNNEYSLEVLKELPKALHILYSIQYKYLAEKISRDLKKLGFKILGFEQVLGCSKIKPKASLLLVGSGRFHSLGIAFSSGKPVYIYNNSQLDKVTEKEIEDYKKRQKAKFAKFLMSDNIGILFTSKSGQSKLNQASKIKKQLKAKYKDKKFYLFLADTINLAEMENFKIDMFVNTACPGLEQDSSKIINLEKVLEL